MKRLAIVLLLAAASLVAQTSNPLPSQVFGALVFYNQGAASGKVNGSFFAAIPFPGAPAGTYIYNSIDLLSNGHGQVIGVPSTGFAQHLVWMTPNVELFGLLGAGVSFGPNGQPSTGTNVGSAFAGGAGVNIKVGSKGFYVPVVAKVVNAQGFNTLVGGVGISWGK